MDSCGTHEGAKYWINTECCGVICASMTYLLILFGAASTSRLVIFPWFGFSAIGLFHLLVFNSMCIMAVISHYRAMTTDPGAVPKNACPPFLGDIENGPRYFRPGNFASLPKNLYCSKCVGFKPARAHHCSVCNRCIVKMDHHCPWINNCVGIGNQKLFINFLLYIFSISLYSMVLNVWRMVHCIYDSDMECYDTLSDLLCIIFLFCEEFLFGLFTCCMFFEQLTSMTTGSNQIDRLKMASDSGSSKQSESLGYNEVFGCNSDIRFQIDWLMPQPVKFPMSLRSSIFGYELLRDPNEISDDFQMDSVDTNKDRCAVDGPTPADDEADPSVPAFRKRGGGGSSINPLANDSSAIVGSVQVL